MRALAFVALMITSATVPTAPARAAETDDIPRLTFQYGDIFDAQCYQAIQKPPDTPLIEELRAKIDTFRRQWNVDTVSVLRAVVKITGVPFAFHEGEAALFTCPSFTNGHLPLMFTVRNFLKGNTDRHTAPMVGFTHIVAHELLHRYVDDRLGQLPGATTPLLTKYASEPPATRNHLHVLSLLEMAFQTLGREDDVRANRATGNTAPPIQGIRAANDMTRAHEIIAAEHAQAFVDELRARSPWPWN